MSTTRASCWWSPGPRAWERLALLALAAAAAGSHLAWILEDAAPMPHPYDPYLYLSKTLRFVDWLRGEGGGSLWNALRELSLDGRPPLYQLLSAPFVLGFGRSVDAALGVNLVFAVLLPVGVHALCREASSGRAGLLAALLAVSYPPIVHLTHVYRPHAALPACTAISLWLLLRLLRERSIGAAFAFAGSLAFGLLIHPTFVWVLAAPTLAVGLHLVLFAKAPRLPATARQLPSWLAAKLLDPFVCRGLFPGTLAAGALVLPWYFTQMLGLLETARGLAEAETVLTVGFPEVAASFWWYLRTAPGALSNVLAILAGAGIAGCVAGRRAAHALIAFAAIAGYAILSLLWVQGWWYFAPLLPLAAAATGLWIASLRRRTLAVSLAGVAAAVAVFAFCVVSWGTPAWSRPIATALGAPLDSPTCATPRPAAFCPGPPRQEHWPVSEILGAILEDDPLCADGRRICRLFLVVRSGMREQAHEWSMVTSGLFLFHAAVDWPQARFVFGGYPAPHCGMQQMLETDYVVHFGSRRKLDSDCFGVWSAFLRSPPESFSDAHRALDSFELPGGESGTLLKRVKPLGVAGEVAIAAAFRRAARAVRADAGAQGE